MKLQVIIPDKEAEKIIELAEKDDRSISNYLRKVILEKIKNGK